MICAVGEKLRPGQLSAGSWGVERGSVEAMDKSSGSVKCLETEWKLAELTGQDVGSLEF